MQFKETFARVAGGATGAVTAFVFPHVACLGPVLIGTIGAGAAAEQAQSISYLLGGGLVVAGIGIGSFGLQKCTKPECALFGETPRVRFKKAAQMAAPAFLGMALVNTALGRGLSDPALTAQAIEFALAEGRSIFDVIASVCTTGTVPTPGGPV